MKCGGDPTLFIMSELQYVVSEEEYKVFAGADWPSYKSFISGNYQTTPIISTEIKTLIDNCYKVKDIRFQNESKKLLTTFIINTLLPAVLGLSLFVFLSSAWYKLLYLIPAAWIVNAIWQHALHKWLTHKSFEPTWWAKPFILWILTIPGLYQLKPWVQTHLYHHRHSDTIEDPFASKLGFFSLIISANKCKDLKEVVAKKINLPKEIEFIDKYFYQLYICNLVLFFVIDPDIFLLSFLIFRFYAAFFAALSNYVIHSGAKSEPVDLRWYWELIFFGERLHKSHHERPGVLNLSTKGKIEPASYYINIIAKKTTIDNKDK